MDQLVDDRRGRRPGADHPDQEPLHVRQSALPGRVEPLRPFISRPISREPERQLGPGLSARDGPAAKMDSLDPRIPRPGFPLYALHVGNGRRRPGRKKPADGRLFRLLRRLQPAGPGLYLASAIVAPIFSPPRSSSVAWLPPVCRPRTSCDIFPTGCCFWCSRTSTLSSVPISP